MGVPVKLHKLIYKFMDDLEDIVHDVKLEELEARGEATNYKVNGSATILEVFEVTVGKGQKAQIFGSKVLTGELFSKNKFRVIRDDEVIADKLTVMNLKHHKKNVSQIEKGQECGISFNVPKGQLDL